MEINLSNGTIRTKNTFLDSYGILHVNGIEATNGSFSGTVNATDGSFSGTISSSTITGGTITGATISGNDITGGTIDGTSITGGSINIGYGAFIVDSSGNVNCQSINISGGTIDIGTNFHVSSDGSVTANNGSFTGDIDANSLRVQDKIIIYSENENTQLTFGDYVYIESATTYDSSYRTRVGIINDDNILVSYLSFGVETKNNGSLIYSSIEYNAAQHRFNGSIDAKEIYGTNLRASNGLWLATGGNSFDGYTYTNIENLFAATSHTHSSYARPTTLYRGSTAYVETYSSGGNYYLIPSSTSVNTYLGVNSNGMRFRGVSAAVGTFSERVTINGAAVSTSDKYDKTNINNISEAYENMFLDIEPVTYMRKNLSPSDDHDRIHCGLIAQQLQEAAEKNGLSTETFAGICIENLEEPLPDGRTTRYGIAYNELHGLEIHMIQKLYKTISTLQEKVESLEKQLSAYTS